MKKYWLTGFIIVFVAFIAATLYAQSSQPACYANDFGLTITDAAQAIVDRNGLSLPDMELSMRNNLTRYQAMTSTCFTGEMGLIRGQLPNRIFAVFTSDDGASGVLRVMTEDEYYPPPFSAQTQGWQRNTANLEIELPQP